MNNMKMSAGPELRDVLDQITFGVVGSLEQKEHVTDVRVVDCGSAKKKFIEDWEETNGCKLPNDLKSFYLTMNGMLIQWSMEWNGNTAHVGNLEINPIESLILLSEEGKARGLDDVSLADIDTDEDIFDEKGHRKPHFHEKCFTISSEDSYGKICLVYKTADFSETSVDPEIWFLDRSLEWYFLSSSFQQYFRMLVIHLGITGWPYLFTKIGLSPESEHLFSLYIPQQLHHMKIVSPEPHPTLMEDTDVHKLDFSTIFKSKSGEKKKIDATKHTKSSTTTGKLRLTRPGALKSSFKNILK